MKKIITLTFLLVSLFLSATVFSQSRKKIHPEKSGKPVSVAQLTHFLKLKQAQTESFKKTNAVLAAGDCQIIEPPYVIDSSTVLEVSDFDFQYAVGTNPYGTIQVAQFYNFSTYPANSYLNAVLLYFWDAYADDSDYTKIVPINIYNGTTGKPGALIGSVDLTLGDIATDIENGDPTEVDFTGIALPASKKIFISVDMSNLSQEYYTDTTTYGDYLGLFSSDWDSTTVNSAWEQLDDNTWHAFSDADDWDAKVSIAMEALIGTSNGTCSQIVPVRLRSFTGQKFGSANKLLWQTANELNNKGFEIQRSADGINYVTIGYVAAQSASSAYSFVDAAPFDQVSYYRFKQVDVNGNVSYSKTVTVVRTSISKAGIVSAFPIPATSVLNVVVNVPATNAASLIVSDLTGKILILKTIQTSSTNQTVPLNISALAKGTYFVRLVGDGENKLLKFVKQ